MTTAALNGEVQGNISADRYERLELIGTGSFGDVYRGWDREAGVEVALKVIDLENVEDDIQDIHKEVATLAQCRSENITEYFASVMEMGTTELLIVMELMACSVGDLLTDDGSPLDERSIAFVLRETLKALVYLHDCQRIHRDVKSANILLSAHGEVKMSDFGVSGKLSKTVAFKRRTFVGSPFWMAPEVIKANAGGDGYSDTADIWSLGVTAFEMAMGRPPHADLHPMRALFLIPNEEAPRLDGPFSQEFKSFIAQCLQKEPSLRPSAATLLRHPFLSGPHDSGRLAELVQIYSEKKCEARSSSGQAFRPNESAPGQARWDFDTHQARQPVTRASLRSHQINDWTIRNSTWGGTLAARQLPRAGSLGAAFSRIPEAVDLETAEQAGSSVSSAEDAGAAWSDTVRALPSSRQPAAVPSSVEGMPSQADPHGSRQAPALGGPGQLPQQAQGQLWQRGQDKAFYAAAQSGNLLSMLLQQLSGPAQGTSQPGLERSEGVDTAHTLQDTGNSNAWNALEVLLSNTDQLVQISPVSDPMPSSQSHQQVSSERSDDSMGPLAHFLLARWQHSPSTDPQAA